MISIINRRIVYYVKCVQKDSYFFLLMFMLNLPYVWQIYSNSFETGIRKLASGSLRVLCIAFVIDMLLRGISSLKIRCFTRGVILCLSAMAFFMDVFSLYHYHCVVNRGMMFAVLATNFREASEFFRDYLLNGSFWLVFALGVLCIFVIIRAMVWGMRYSGIAVYRPFILVLGVSVLCSLNSLGVILEHCSIVRYVEFLGSVLQEKRQYEMMVERYGNQEIIMKNESTIPYVVFILGESTSRNHMSLYGYPLKTTPCLDERHKRGEVICFEDVVSPDSNTICVMEKLFTFARHDSSGNWFEYGNIFDIAKSAGYHTVWLSNQESSGIYGNVGAFYANRCEDRAFTMLRDTKDNIRERYDETVIPLLEDSLRKASEKNFFVIHLMGAHVTYRKRYPSKFQIFEEKDEPNFLTKEQKSRRAEYDNAVLYNDYVIDAIIRHFNDKNAIVIYVSDHGEEVHDNPERRDFFGHAESTGSRYVIEVPMIFWMSQTFKKAYPDLVMRLEKSTYKPFMTDDMIHVFMDIMQIETQNYDSSKSVINEHFDEGQLRIYAGKEYRKEE